jgi:tRNA pseudouridine65 synthase
MQLPVPILYEDEHLLVANKPGGIMVHRTSISEDTVFLLQLLRKQVGQRLYPIHRLDRGTSGALLFAKNPEIASLLGEQFASQQPKKRYYALVRGYVEAEATIDYAIPSGRTATLKEAVTHYRRLQQREINYGVGRYPTARYSWVEAIPKTGRTHQIRRHFAHLRHPVIGDRRYGDLHHNKFFKQQQLPGLMLHAHSLTFFHPVTEEEVTVVAPLPVIFQKALDFLGFTLNTLA